MEVEAGHPVASLHHRFYSTLAFNTILTRSPPWRETNGERNSCRPPLTISLPDFPKRNEWRAELIPPSM